MKKVLVFAVDTVTGNKVCYIYREPVDEILVRYASVVEWAIDLLSLCNGIKVTDAIVVDDIAIRCLI